MMGTIWCGTTASTLQRLGRTWTVIQTSIGSLHELIYVNKPLIYHIPLTRHILSMGYNRKAFRGKKIEHPVKRSSFT